MDSPSLRGQWCAATQSTRLLSYSIVGVSWEVRVIAISQRASVEVNVSLHLKVRILLGVFGKIGVASWWSDEIPVQQEEERRVEHVGTKRWQV